MKIRYDFVSNSSSSSFMLIGQAFEPDEIHTALIKLHPEKASEDYDSYNDVDELATELNLEFACGISDYYDMYAIGLPFNQMNDNETKKQFMDRIKASLSKAFGNNIEVREILDGGYDN